MKNTNSAFRGLILLGLFAIPFTPLIVSNAYFFPFITGKAFFFRITVEIITALWLILALRDREYLPRFSWITGAITIFTGIVLVADLFGVNLDKSLWSNFERMEGWVTIAHLWLYYLVASSVLVTSRMWGRLFNTSIGVSVILIFHALAQLAGQADIHQGSSRLDASLGNAAYFAVYLLIHFYITMLMLYRNWHSTFLRYMYGTIALFQLFILYHTGTRGSILGLIGGLGVAALILIVAKRDNKAVRNTGIGLVVGLGLLVGGFQMIKTTSFVRNSEMLSRLAAISLADAAPRLAIWEMAYKGFQEKPILGWGQENFNYVFNKYYEPSMYAQEQWFDRAHNVFFDWLIAAGIVGLLSYLSLFAFAFWYIWKSEERLDFFERVILTSLLVAYFIHNLFVFDHLVSYILFVTLLAYIHSKTPLRNTEFVKKVNDGKILYTALPFIVIAFSISLYYVNIRPMQANKTLIKAISPQSEGAVKNLEYFKKALAYQGLGTQEMREQLVSAALTASKADIDVSIKQDFFDFTKSELEKWTTKNPLDARAHLFTGNFLSRMGLANEAQVYYEKARDLSPRKQTILFELGANYINQKKYAEGLEVFKHAYELDTSFENAKFMYAIGALYSGDTELANQLLASLENKGLLDDQRLINAYAETKQYGKVVEIYKKRLENEPKNTQARISLAATYLALGNRAAAIREIQQAIVDMPEFKEQGEYYIKEIRAGRNP